MAMTKTLMRLFFATVALAASTLASPAHADECDSATTQREMNECYRRVQVTAVDNQDIRHAGHDAQPGQDRPFVLGSPTAVANVKRDRVARTTQTNMIDDRTLDCRLWLRATVTA